MLNKELSCEICGRKIKNESIKITVEGINLMVCYGCSKIGEIGWKIGLGKMRNGEAHESKKIPISMNKFLRRKKAPKSNDLENYEVIENFSEKIKKGREKKGISQEEFAKLIKEKLSIIQKIESGKMAPSLKLSREIEHILKIELLSNRKKELEDISQINTKSTLTIGDILHFKKKEKIRE